MDWGSLATTILTVVIVVVLIGAAIFGALLLIIKSVKTAPEGYQDVIFRLDRLAGSRGPGIYLMIPFFERFVQQVSIKNEQISLPGERTPVSDGPEITSTAIVFYKVVDPGLAITRMGNYVEAVRLVSRTAFQEAFSSSTLTEAQSQRPAIARKIKEILDRKTQTTQQATAQTDTETVLWGIIIISVEISDVDLPDELAQQISRQAVAERELQARTTLASNEKAIALKLVEADEIYQQHPGARQLRNSNQLLDTIGPKDKVIILVPTDQLSGLNSGLVGTLALQAANDQSQPPN